MTIKELERISDVLSRLYERDPDWRTSSYFPQAQLCMSGEDKDGGYLSQDEFDELKEHVDENGISCKIIDHIERRNQCKCFSVKDWLYFRVKGDDCLRRVLWNQVEFLDTDLICLHPAGEGGDSE